MKKIAKLLAFVIAFAMVMSLVVIPVSVNAGWAYEAENLLAKITEAKDQTVKSTDVPTLNITASTSWGYFNKTTSTTAHTVDLQTDGSVLISGRNEQEDGIRQIYTKVYTGHTYLASARVKLADGAAAQSNFEIKVGKAGKLDNKDNWISGTTSINSSKAVNDDGWCYVYNEFTVNAVENATADTHRENGAHVYFSLPGVKSGETTTFCDYYIRDMKLVDITDSKNLVHTRNADLESGEMDLTKDSNATAVISADAKRTGNYGVSLSAYKKNTNSVRITGVSKTNDVWYRATVWAKLASESTSNKAYMVVSENGTKCAICNDSADGWQGSDVELSATEWKPVYVDFKTTAYECTDNDGVCYSSTTISNSTKIVRNQLHFGPRFRTEDVQVYLDDFSIEKFTPAAFTATLTKGTVTTNSATVGVTFSAAPTSFTTDNVEVEGATVAVEGSGTSYTISLSALKPDTSYTVTLKNVKDAYGQTITDGSTTVKTIAEPLTGEVLADNGKDGDFNTIHADMVKSGSATIAQAEVDGEKVMSITTSTNTSPAFRINTLSKSIENTGKYVVTYRAKLAADSEVTAVNLWGSQSSVATNKRRPTNFKTASHQLSADEWTDITAFYDMSIYDPAGSDKIDYAKRAYYKVIDDAEGFKLVTGDPDAPAEYNTVQAAFDTAYAAAEEAGDTTTLDALKAKAQAAYDKVVDPSTWVEGPMHIGFSVTGSGVVYIDKVEIRKATALDYSANDYARITADANKVSAVLTSDDATKTVYVMAAKYEGTKMTDLEFGMATIGSSNNVAAVELEDVDDTYTFFIWDSSLNALSATKLVSALK